jgi:hypothetical protein
MKMLRTEHAILQLAEVIIPDQGTHPRSLLINNEPVQLPEARPSEDTYYVIYLELLSSNPDKWDLTYEEYEPGDLRSDYLRYSIFKTHMVPVVEVRLKRCAQMIMTDDVLLIGLVRSRADAFPGPTGRVSDA